MVFPAPCGKPWLAVGPFSRRGERDAQTPADDNGPSRRGDSRSRPDAGLDRFGVKCGKNPGPPLRRYKVSPKQWLVQFILGYGQGGNAPQAQATHLWS